MAKTKKTKIKIFLAITSFILLVRFFGGVYEDDEFNESYFFIKNSPTWKWHFYSPRGMSDLKTENMSAVKKQEQLMYERYVPNRLLSVPI